MKTGEGDVMNQGYESGGRMFAKKGGLMQYEKSVTCSGRIAENVRTLWLESS
jgi:hypothetical protein